MNLESWAEDLTKQVWEEWNTNFSEWKQGFKLFYSPIRKNPNLLILSYNPGGDADSFEDELRVFEQGDFTLPKDHEFYEEGYRMAKRMKNFFYGHENELKNSVAFPIFFFRSKTVDILDKKLEKEKYKKMKRFCNNITKQIIGRIEPKHMLVLGACTFDHLKQILPVIKEENMRKDSQNHRVCIEAEWKDTLIFAIKHPTGRDPTSTTDWNNNKKRFFELLYT